MVGAAQAAADLALGLFEEPRAAVAADVVEGADLAVFAADDGDALAADLAADEGARLGNGGDVAGADPAGAEDVGGSQSSTAGSRKAAGGSIVARSSGCSVASRSAAPIPTRAPAPAPCPPARVSSITVWLLRAWGHPRAAG